MIGPVTEPSNEAAPWRVGTHYAIHVYEGDRPVATFHTVADAARAVADHNRLAARDERVARDAVEKTLSEVKAEIRGQIDRLGVGDSGRHRNGLYAAIGIIAAARERGTP